MSVRYVENQGARSTGGLWPQRAASRKRMLRITPATDQPVAARARRGPGNLEQIKPLATGEK